MSKAGIPTVTQGGFANNKLFVSLFLCYVWVVILFLTKLLWDPAVGEGGGGGSSSHSSANSNAVHVGGRAESCWERRVRTGSAGATLTKWTRSRGLGVVKKEEGDGPEERPSFYSPRQRALWPDAINHSRDTNRSHGKKKRKCCPGKKKEEGSCELMDTLVMFPFSIWHWKKQKSWMGHWY